jgi:hypothetical protein
MLRDKEEANKAQPDDVKQQRVEARIAELHWKLSRKRAQAAIEQEARVQRRLGRMGVCCQGYRWVRQAGAGGWRCAGGSRFVGDEVVAGGGGD